MDTTIVEEIDRIKTNIANAYASLEEKGATLPTERNSANLSAVIVEVPTGGGDEELTNSYMSVIDSTLGANCTKLPNGITSIGKYAFYQCTNLALTKLPNGITSIGTYAFYYCTNLALTSLPETVQTIESSAFYNCNKLTLTKLPDALKSISSSAFNGCVMMTISELPSGLTTIPSSAFSGCERITISTLPENLTSIGSNAFTKCTSLNVKVIPSGVKILSSYAFDGARLGTMDIKATDFKEINGRALYGATFSPLRTLIMRATTPPYLASNGLYDPTKIYVPDESVDAYKAATNWSKYASIIKPISERPT